MGKRKSTTRKPQKKLKQKLDKSFACLFCNHEGTVSVKLNHEDKVGDLSCTACGVTFQNKINALSEAVDVYSDWVDACEAANKKAALEDDDEFDD
ncbi:transcription elongation factor 1 [Gorgonomyces haynaldii]|nr:transcription elongation factor 1 [Gorgonomyces haynaldii]